MDSKPQRIPKDLASIETQSLETHVVVSHERHEEIQNNRVFFGASRLHSFNAFAELCLLVPLPLAHFVLCVRGSLASGSIDPLLLLLSN